MSVRTGLMRVTQWLFVLLLLVCRFTMPRAHGQGSLPVYLNPTNRGYPLLPDDPIYLLNASGGNVVTIWPNDPHYPLFGQPMIVWPGDPLYSLFPSTPIVMLAGDPGYPLSASQPAVIWPGGIGVGDPIVINPGDPDYPALLGNPIVIAPGDPLFPGPNDPNAILAAIPDPGPGGPGTPLSGGSAIVRTSGLATLPTDFGSSFFYSSPGDGKTPKSGLLQIGSYLYGTTFEGGAYGYGTIYRLDTSGGNYSILHSFTGGSDGANPICVLVNDAFNLFGTCSSGGTNGNGTVFSCGLQLPVIGVMHAFTGADGAHPVAGLCLGADRAYYGTAAGGGQYRGGVVFRVTGGNYKVIHNFQPYSPEDGWQPYSAVIQNSTDGFLYGTTRSGGIGLNGTVYSVSTTGTPFTLVHAFSTTYSNGKPVVIDGRVPVARLLQGTNGLYGTTVAVGGTNNGTLYGTGRLFQITPPTGPEIPLHDFGNAPDGAQPMAGVTQGPGGDLYGTTAHGGDIGRGTVYKDVGAQWFAGGSIVIHSFDNPNVEGTTPLADLILGTDGYFYGTNSALGMYGYGTVFKMDASGNVTILHSFGDPSQSGGGSGGGGSGGGGGPTSIHLIGLSLNPTSVRGGQTSTGTVTMDTPAPATGLTVTLSSDNGSAGVPGTVLIPAGSVTATFTIQTIPVATTTVANIKATYNADVRTAPLTITPPQLLSLVVSPSTVVGGTAAVGVVSLDGAAPQGGITVAISSNNGAAQVPAQVVVTQGMVTATFSIPTLGVNASVTATISATYNGVTKTATLTINPLMLVSLSLNPTTVGNGANSVARLVLNGPAPPNGVIVTMGSSNTAVATAPPIVRVLAGQAGTSFLVATNQVTAPATSVISATLGTQTLQQTLTVTTGGFLSLSPTDNATVESGSSANTPLGGATLQVQKNVGFIANGLDACTYLKFDLTNVVTPPYSATLKLNVNTRGFGGSTPPGTISNVFIYGVADTTWTENTIDWLNAPGLNTTTCVGAGTFLTGVDVPLLAGVAAFDISGYIKTHLGQKVSLLVIHETTDNLQLVFHGRQDVTPPALVLTSTYLNDLPPPMWADNIVPSDMGGAGDSGPSASDSVDLASGVEENVPGADLVSRNPIGPTALFSRLYRSAAASQNHSSPGLAAGWTHNYDVTAVSATGYWLPILLSYPNGGTELWTPVTNIQGLPTGAFTLRSGTPYLVNGTPDPLVPGHWLSLTMTFKDHSAWTLLPDPDNQTNYRLARIANLIGHSITIQYDPSGRVQTVTNDAEPQQTLLTFNYNNTNLASVSDAYGRTVNYTFTTLPNVGTELTAVSQVNTTTAQQWQYGYTAINNWPLLTSTAQPDPTGNGVTLRTHAINYYPDGRVQNLVDANNNTRQYTYQSLTSTLVQVYDANQVLQDSYTQLLGNLNNDVGTTDAANHSDQVNFGDPNNIYKATSYVNRNAQTVTASYDTVGNVTLTQAPCNNGLFTTTLTYDYTFPLGTLTQVDDITSTTFAYYPNGMLYSVTSPDPSNGINTVTTTYVYTPLGNVKTVTFPAPDAVAGHTATVTYNYVYDASDGTIKVEALGEPLTVTDPLGHVAHFRWDNRGNLITVIDALGNRWDYTPNLVDDIVSVQSPATGQTGTGRAHLDTKYLYLSGPAMKALLYDEGNGGSNPARTSGVTLGNEGEATAATGNVEQETFKFDGAQRLTNLNDALGHTYKHQYNNVSDLTGLTFPSGDVTLSFGHDPDHNLNTFTNGRKQKSTFTLATDDSRLTRYQRGDSSQVTYIYDWAGRVQNVSDANTTLSYDYNAAGLLQDETCIYAATNGIPNTQFNYAYNRDGSLAAISMPWGSYAYSYDAAGRLTDLSLPTGDTVHYDYDDANRLIHQHTRYNDTYYTYNPVGQITDQRVVNYWAGSPQFDTLLNEYNGFHYDGAGNLLGYTWTCPQLNPAQKTAFANTFTFTYDGFDHLTSETSSGNLITVPANLNTNYAWTHVSDAGDNLTTLRNQTYSGNVNDQVTFDSFTNNNAAYKYDADGDPTLYQFASCSYDSEGHLTSYTDPVTQQNTTFGYRPDGLRAWMQAGNGAKTYYLYLGGHLAFEWTPDPQTHLFTTSRMYGWGATGLTETLSQNNGAQTLTVYSYDPLGNVVGRQTGASGFYFDLVSLYDAFGWTRGSWYVPGNDFTGLGLTGDSVGWGGQWGAVTVQEPAGGADANTTGQGQKGLMLLGFRYYSPDTGRFLTRDPIGYDGGNNLYAYTRNNPVMSADPSGLDDDDDPDANILPHNINGSQFYYKAPMRFINKGAGIVGGGLAALGESNPISIAMEVITGKRATRNELLSNREREVAAVLFFLSLCPEAEGIVSAEVTVAAKDLREGQKYMTYVIVNDKKVVYVGKASGVGTIKRVLSKRFSNHHHWHPEIGDRVFIIDFQKSKAANAGAEQVWYDWYKSKGAILRNDKSPLDWRKTAERIKSRAKVDAFFKEMSNSRF